MLTAHLLCIGGMIFTFYKARGMTVGSSLVDEDNLDLPHDSTQNNITCSRVFCLADEA